MAGKYEARLKDLGLELPQASTPAANYVPFVRAGNLLFMAGQVCIWNGERRFVGKVGREFDLKQGQEAARLSALNVLAQAKKGLDGDLDRIERVIQLKGYVNCMPNFTDVSAVVNGASELMIDVFGDAGRHSRTALGVAVMPFDVAIEVEAMFLVKG